MDTLPGPHGLHRLVAELKRRHVFRIACAYAVVGYGIMQAANNFFPPLNLPPWTTTLVAVLLLLGFPVALVLAWAFDITPEGVRRTSPILGRSADPAPARRLGYVGVGMLLALVTFGMYATRHGWRGSDEPPETIAVLPFTNLSGDPENEYFSDGITEDVSGQLADISGLRAISRTSVMQYKRTTKSAREIGRELGVGAILEGAVRRSGDNVRVTARLIDAHSDEQIWSETYDRRITDVFALQSDIARQIAAKLDARLNAGDRRRLAAAAARPIDPRAYEAYLRGIYHSDEGRQREAIRAFEQAIAIDPELAPAFAGIARNYYFLALYGMERPDVAFERVREAATRALEIDPGLADAHATIALYAAHRDGDWAAADRHFRDALELGPNRAQVHHDYAHFLLATGRLRESTEQSRIAAELDPANSMLTACAGWHGFTAGQYQVAVDRSLKALMMMPDMFWAEMILGWAYEQEEHFPEAIAAFHKAIAHSGNSSFATAALGHALAAAGRPTEARLLLAELEARRKSEYVSAYDIATIHAGLGETDATLEWLGRAWKERAGFAIHVGWDPRLATLHGDRRFTALLHSIGVPEQAIRKPAAAPAGRSAGAVAM